MKAVACPLFDNNKCDRILLKESLSTVIQSFETVLTTFTNFRIILAVIEDNSLIARYKITSSIRGFCGLILKSVPKNVLNILRYFST